MYKQLFNETNFLRYVFDVIPSLLFIVDSDVRIHHLNAAARDLVRADKNEVLFKRGGDVLHCIHASESPEGCGRADYCKFCLIRNSVNKAFHGKKVNRETTKFELFSDGRVTDLHLMVTASPLAYEGNDFVLLVLEDVSKIKSIEEELHRNVARLQAVNHELDQFVSAVSHDLMAPLRRMEGFARALVEDYFERIDEIGRDYLSRIRTGAAQMMELTHALLRLSRLNREELKISTVDLSVMARTAAADLSENAPGRAVEFTIPPEIKAKADPALMQVVIDNLVGNAWKFTQKKPVALIEFGITNNSGIPIYFVRDNGSGFNAAQGNKLFTPFQRFHAANEFPGIGIGLATAKRIINRHGGSIWAESETDKGATFFFSLS